MRRTQRTWKIALGQMEIAMGDKRTNTAAMLKLIGEAAEKRCDVIVFPECCFAGWLSPAAHASAEVIPGPFSRRLCSLAKKHQISIVAGVEEKGKEGQIFNSAILIDPNGSLRLHHRKINELEAALPIYTRGTSLSVTQLGERQVGLSICADSWRPELTDALYLMGARIIFSPSAWAVEPGGESTNLNWIRETYRQRIGERDLFIIAPNGVGPVTEGPWKGRVLQGNSLVIGPRGDTLLCGPTGEPALLCFELH